MNIYTVSINFPQFNIELTAESAKEAAEKAKKLVLERLNDKTVPCGYAKVHGKNNPETYYDRIR